jgi:hypothetical protein
MAGLTVEQKQTFLAGLHVGMLSIPRSNSTGEMAAPLTSPVWYGYQAGGELWLLTMATSMKGKLLKVGLPVSFCVQNEQPPYAYVSVTGTVARITPSLLEEELRPLARRYLGIVGGDAYTDAEGVEDTITVHISIDSWLAVDYGSS